MSKLDELEQLAKSASAYPPDGAVTEEDVTAIIAYHKLNKAANPDTVLKILAVVKAAQYISWTCTQTRMDNLHKALAALEEEV